MASLQRCPCRRQQHISVGHPSAPPCQGGPQAWPDLPSLQDSERRGTAKCKFDNQTPCWGSWTAQPALILDCLSRRSLAAQGLFSILSSAGPSFMEYQFSGPGRRSNGREGKACLPPPLCGGTPAQWAPKAKTGKGKHALGWRPGCYRVEGFPG